MRNDITMVNFDEYIQQGEPQKRERGYAWQTAIGLQAVDGLKPCLLYTSDAADEL